MLNWFRKYKRILQYRRLYNYFNDKSFDAVLEIGSGNGLHSWKGRINCNNFIATDIKKTEFIDRTVDITKIPFEDNAFELTICLFVLEHLRRLEDVLKARDELIRVTVGGGLLMVAVPFIYPEHNYPQDTLRLTKGGLERLFDMPIELELKTLNWLPNFYSSITIIFRIRKHQTPSVL